MIVPIHLQIETINGVCSSGCTLCMFHTRTRKPRRVAEVEFENILTEFLPYRAQL